MSGLSATGFAIQRLPEIKAGMEASLVQAFGNVDLRAESIFGQLVGISSEVDAILWQIAEDVYNSQYPDSASGVSLDYVCALNGVTRIPAFATQVEATVTGAPGTLLTSGREATNAQTGDVYRLPVSVEIRARDAIGAKIVTTGTAAGDYTVTIRGVAYTYTSPGGETAQQILTGVQAAVAGLRVVELPVPLIYLDEARSFGGALDDAATRLDYYRCVLDKAEAAVAARNAE